MSNVGAYDKHTQCSPLSKTLRKPNMRNVRRLELDWGKGARQADKLRPVRARTLTSEAVTTPVSLLRHGHLHDRAPPAIPGAAARSRPSPPASTLLVFLVRTRTPSHFSPGLSGVRVCAGSAGGRRGGPVGLRDRVPGERGVAGAMAHRLGPPRATPGYPACGHRRARPCRAQEHPQGGEAALRAAFPRHHRRFGNKTIILLLPTALAFIFVQEILLQLAFYCVRVS